MHGAEVIAQGFHFGMLTIAALGALFITGEYSTGMVRSTFAAVPTRIPVLAAKALTLTALTAAVTLLPERAQNGHHSAARSIASKASANRPIPLHGAVLVDQGRRMLASPIWPSARGCSPLRPPQSGSRHVADRGSAALPAPRPRPWPASRSWRSYVGTASPPYTPRNTRPSGPDSAKVSRWCTSSGTEPDRQSDRPHTGTRLGRLDHDAFPDLNRRPLDSHRRRLKAPRERGAAGAACPPPCGPCAGLLWTGRRHAGAPSGGCSSTRGLYSTSWMRPSKVRCSIISRATSG